MCLIGLDWCLTGRDHNQYLQYYWTTTKSEDLSYLHSVTIQMKATEQYFPVVLFVMLYTVVFNLSQWTKF